MTTKDQPSGHALTCPDCGGPAERTEFLICTESGDTFPVETASTPTSSRWIPSEYALAQSTPGEGIRIVQRGESAWAVFNGGNVLRKDGEWESEPTPSSRTEAFIASTRWTTAQEAAAAADLYLETHGGAIR